VSHRRQRNHSRRLKMLLSHSALWQYQTQQVHDQLTRMDAYVSPLPSAAAIDFHRERVRSRRPCEIFSSVPGATNLPRQTTNLF
jgi:hypothetical protein